MGIVYDRARMSQTPRATSWRPRRRPSARSFISGWPTTRRSAASCATTRRGERIRLRIRVFDGDGAPVPDALVGAVAGRRGRRLRASRGSEGRAHARRASADSGVCRPGQTAPACSRRSAREQVRDAQGRPQASHINVCLLARGLLRQVYTRIYFAGDPGARIRRRARARSRGAAPDAPGAARRPWRVGLRHPASGRRRNRVLRSLIGNATCHHA